MPDTSEINESLSNLEQELSTLKSASDEIKKAKDFAQSSFLESKKLLDETISEIESSLSAMAKHVESYEELSKNLINTTQNNNEIVISEAKKINKAAVDLFNNVDNLQEKIDKIDFPNRLDKLDTAVTGINTVIQNLFGRFETVERNLKDEFQTKITDLGKSLTAAEAKLIDDFDIKTKKIEDSLVSTENNLRNDLFEELDQKYSDGLNVFEKYKKLNLILFISILVVSVSSFVTLLVKMVF